MIQFGTEVDTNRRGASSQYVFVDGYVVSAGFAQTYSRPAKRDQWNPITAR